MFHHGDLARYLRLLLAQYLPAAATIAATRPHQLPQFLALNTVVHIGLVGAALRHRAAALNNPYRKHP